MKFVKPTESPTVNVLFYGPPKSGKSLGAASAPGRILLLNPDTPNASRQAHLRNPDGRIHELEKPAYTEGKLGWLDLLIEVSNAVADPDNAIADTVVLDPVGELYRSMLEEGSRRALRPSLPQYGDVGTHIERFCRFLCQLPHVNAVFCCHELIQKDESSGETRTIPFTGTQAGSAVLGQKLMAMVDVVGYTAVHEEDDGRVRYMAQLLPAKGRIGGDRFACLGTARDVNVTEWLATIVQHEQDQVPQPQDQSQPQEA